MIVVRPGVLDPDPRYVSVRIRLFGRTGRTLSGQDKGQRLEIESFLTAVRNESPMPISLDSLGATARATLAVGSSLSLGRPVSW